MQCSTIFNIMVQLKRFVHIFDCSIRVYSLDALDTCYIMLKIIPKKNHKLSDIHNLYID